TRTGGLVQVHPLLLTFDELVAVAGESNLHRLDRELDDLRSAGLLDPRRAGFNGFNAATADLTPTPLAAHMYVRCCGSRASAVDYFNLTPYPPDPPATSPTLASGQAPDAPTGEITVPAP